MSSTSAKQACCFRCDGPSPQIFCQECGLGYHSECAIDGCDGSGQDNQITPCSQCRSLRISTDKWRSFAAFSKEKLNQILFGLLTLPNNPSPKIMELDAEHLQLTTDKLGPKKFLSLQQVRKKALAGFYTCPEELLLDLRTIRHFIGANCSVWIVRPVIDYIERIEQHLQMIDLCPHCTFHCLTSGSSWFIQSCPKPHQLVLAQYKAITWWPAKLLKYDPFNARVLVSFFGREHHCRWTSVSSCFLMIDPDLSVNYQERILIPPDMGEDFDEAVDEFLYHVEKLHQASVKPRFAQFMKRWNPCDGVFITESKTRRSQSQRDDNLVIIDPFDDDNPIPLEILLEMSSNVEKSVIGSKIVRENSATVSSNELITSNSVNNSHDSNSRDNNIDETMDVKHLHNTSVTGPDNSEKIFSDSSLNFDVDMNGSIQSNGMNTSKTNESHPVTSSGGERPPKNQFDPANFVIDSNHIQKIGGKPYQIYDPISKKSISPDEFNRFSTQHITGTEGAYVCAIPTHAGKSCQKETRTTKYKVKRHQMFSLPHRCVMCDKFFTGLLNLRSHMMSKHGLARKS